VKVLVTTEQRFHRADGRVVTAGPIGYDFWKRYLDVFDEVGVLARVHTAPVSGDALREVTGPGVRVFEMPAYVGPWSYLLSFPSLRRAVGAAAQGRSAVIVRAPSPLGALLLGRLPERYRRAFGLEVIGDPLGVFARGSVRHPLRVVFRWWFAAQLRRQCRQAAAIAYVTRRTLQARYPPRAEPHAQFVTSCSSSDLSPSALVARAREPGVVRPPFRLVTVGSLEQAYKGVDVLIRALDLCHRKGLPVSLTVLGDGRERPRLEGLTRALSLEEHVSFVGQVTAPGDVTLHLDASHLFVLASRTEGLPQAMIEAMARGLPCVGSDAGGIPEMLSASDVVAVGSASALAEKLESALTTPETLAAMSARNLRTAREYTSDVQRPRRTAFHEAVRAATREAEETLRG
jgi:glycosyltransferase involved in cell wall biosynthesis